MTHRQTKDGAGTYDRILIAAERLFAKQGFEGTSTRQIVAEVGISLQTLHYHVGDKVSLYNAVLEKSLQSMTEIINTHVERMSDIDLNQEGELDASIEEMIEALFDDFHQHPYSPILMLRQWLEQNMTLRKIEWDMLAPSIRAWVAQVEKGMNHERWQGIDLHLLFFSISWTYYGLFTNPKFLGNVLGLDPKSNEYLEKLKYHAKEMTARMMGRCYRGYGDAEA